MRPLRLSLASFGPFLQPQVVDLRGFRYSKLFLIHGPVGSGKTFLLDGICFALYGRSSGGERDRTGMRNVAAPPEIDTVVVLDFEVASENYRIERRLVLAPENDGGFLPDEVQLWRLPSFGEPSRRDIVSSSLAGVEGMLVRLMGLNADQFCQVAILPQGQFRRFLLASAEERTAIIGRMFDGQKYRRFQTMLSEEHEGLRRQMTEAWREREGITTRYLDTEGDPRERLWRSREELETVSESCLSHQERSVEWERSLESAVRYETLERQQEMSQRELEDLTNDDEAPADALYRRLRESVDDYLRWREATAEIDEITRELDEQRAGYEKLKRETDFLEAEVEVARKREEEKYALGRSLERLQDVREEAEGLVLLEGEVHSAARRLADLGRARTALAQDVKRSQARVAKLEAELQRMEKAEARLVGLRQELALLESRDQQARQRGHLLTTVDQARQREARLKEALLGLQADLETAQERWMWQKAASRAEALQRLKVELGAQQPCPLCGSRDHPQPYREGSPGAEVVEGELEGRVADLKMRCQRTGQELALAEERRARFEGRIEGLAEEGEVEDVSHLLEGLRSSVALMEGKLAERQSYREELRREERELVPNRKKLRQMRLMKERLEATLESAESMRSSRQDRLLDLLEQALGYSVSWEDTSWKADLDVETGRIGQRLEELSQAVYATERAEVMAETFALGLAEARAAERRRDMLGKEAEGLRTALLEAFRLEFKSWTDLSFALNRTAREYQVQSGENSVVDKDTLIRAIKRQLDQSQELLAAVPSPPMKSEQIRHALSREREQVELKISRRASLQRSVEDGVRDVEVYDALVERTRELESRLGSINELANAMAGDNAGGLSFTDWVLQKCFARVLTAANNKLETLAPQRFALLLEQGLEVKVFDYRAGISRSATTLSGGESFLASLALALGLGEVLQGVDGAADRLGTLFIDEGFGYLDQQALDAALECLENLRGEGRTIGLVSHVSDLRERIRAQIIVAGSDAEPTGSRVQVHSA